MPSYREPGEYSTLDPLGGKFRCVNKSLELDVCERARPCLAPLLSGLSNYMSPHIVIVTLTTLVLLVLTVAARRLPIVGVVLILWSIVVIAALIFAMVVIIDLGVLGVVATLSP